MKKLPLIAPQPPRLSAMPDALAAIEASGIYSNSGPVVRAFEAAATERLFGGSGASLAVNNATIGLIIAIREAAEARGRKNGLALMPAFTFAATAHAAEWAGLTPLLVDSDPNDWSLSAEAEERALARFGERVSVIVPYATFGNCIDLDRYAWLSRRYGVGVVVDAAASLGALDELGCGFGAGAPFPIIFSMHATKPFATAEGGLIHCGDPALIEKLRNIGNFGFAGARSAVLPGTNAKLPEVLGAMALAKLENFEPIAAHRAMLADAYRERLDGFELQCPHGKRPMPSFMPLLLPRELAAERPRIIAALAEQGVGAGDYFAPHLGHQPYFEATTLREPTPVADDIARRVLVLPVTDSMTVEDVDQVCAALRTACHSHVRVVREEPLRFATLLVGGGPGGVAFLDAATKQDKLTALAEGLCIVERGHELGGGELPSYAITSDSTAETFLSAAKDNVHPEIAALVHQPGGQEIADYIGKLGVPLARTGPFLRGLGERIGKIVRENGGRVLFGHEVTEAHRLPGGDWRCTLREVASGAVREAIASNLVIATGGYQSETDIKAEIVAGQPLGELAGERLLLGDAVLRLGGIEALRTQLADKPAPRIAIIGASTSAMAAAALMLKAQPAFAFGVGGISLIHRQPLRPFYPSAEAAHADGFTDFDKDDICPVSGFVYRLAGFRLEAREQVLRILRIGGREPDPRFATFRIGEDDAGVRDALDRADLIIGALGYRPRALPLFDMDGTRIALAAHAPGRPRLADQECRVIDAEGMPVPGVWGIGLAAGFVPEGRLGGEKSFRGKANGLWLWQNDVGLIIVDQLLAARGERAAA